jgi:sugar lactone lactonase YvrE
MLKPRLELDARATLGEGPSWDPSSQRLTWVDIEGCRLHRYSPPSGEDESTQLEQMIGVAVVRRSGGYVLGLANGFHAYDPERGSLTALGDPEEDLPGNRFNDGKCDPAGRFWAGTMALSQEEGKGSLYCLHLDGTVEKKLDSVTISNGLDWSLDERTMYYIDTPTRRVTAFAYDRDSARIGNPRTVVRIPDGMGEPDGMTIDAEGMLWIALWGGSMVGRWNPADGELIARIDMPVSQPTSCAFGGPDLETLFITSARSGLSEDALESQPQAGGLFSCRPGVQGLPAAQFRG